MAVQHISREGGIQGLRLKRDSGGPVTIYAAEPGKYDLGKAPHVRQVGSIWGDVVLRGTFLLDGKPEKGERRISTCSRSINIAAGENFSVEVLGRYEVAFAVYDFNQQ